MESISSNAFTPDVIPHQGFNARASCTTSNERTPTLHPGPSCLLTVPGSDFREIREKGFVYIDKTASIHTLMRFGGRVYLARPPGFGRTLFLSTCEAFFRGHKELFKGLAIEKQESSWTPHPVLRFDLALLDVSSPEAFEKDLLNSINACAAEYGIEIHGYNIASRIWDLNEKVRHKMSQHCVVLADNCDIPLLKLTGKGKVRAQVERLCREFFNTLLGDCANIHFLLMMGAMTVTVSDFTTSTVANISFAPQYQDICGFTQTEISRNLAPYVHQLAVSKGISDTACLARLESMYGGFRLAGGELTVSCCSSVLSALHDMDFGYYWYANNTPEYLIKCLMMTPTPTQEYTSEVTLINTYIEDQPDDAGAAVILLQAGYLSFKNSNIMGSENILGYPNEDARYSHCQCLIPLLRSKEEGVVRCDRGSIMRAIGTNDLPKFVRILKVLYQCAFAKSVSQRSRQFSFQEPVSIVLSVIDKGTASVCRCTRSRVNFIVFPPSGIWVFELTRNGSARQALSRVKENKDWEQASIDRPEVSLVGMNYSDRAGCIDGCLVERFSTNSHGQAEGPRQITKLRQYVAV